MVKESIVKTAAALFDEPELLCDLYWMEPNV